MRSRVEAQPDPRRSRSRWRADPSVSAVASEVLALQRFAGNRATTALIQRQAVGVVARPTLQRPGTEKMVCVLQQKLNALGEKQVIDADFGGRTLAAVQKFQRANGITPANGVVEASKWAKLDALTPGCTTSSFGLDVLELRPARDHGTWPGGSRVALLLASGSASASRRGVVGLGSRDATLRVVR